MFNARDLLGQVMGAGITPSTESRAQHAVGSNGLGSAGSPLGGLLGNLAGVASDALGSAKRGVEQNNPLAIGGLVLATGCAKPAPSTENAPGPAVSSRNETAV